MKAEIRNHAFLVGGAVRDEALGLSVADRDWVVVGVTPETMIELGYEPVGKDFPVFIDKQTGEEYALARTERKTAKGYQGFEFSTSTDITLEQDLARRDITINAMAESLEGELIDPFNGMADLQQGIIRHVSDAFVEDPVRVLRVARFAARFQFTVAPETMQLMQEMVSNGEVDALVAERVWTEMHKALQTDNPQIFFETLRECGALARILPEVDELFGIPQTEKYHPEIDTGIHTMMVVKQAAMLSDDTLVRFAALVHDLGKAVTPEEILPSHRMHEQNGLPIIKSMCERLRVPKRYKALALAVSEFHLHMHKMFELKAQTVLRMLERTRSLMDDERAKQIATVCTADIRGRKDREHEAYPQAELFLQYQQAAKNIDSKAIIGNLSEADDIQAAIHRARLSEIKKVKSALKT